MTTFLIGAIGGDSNAGSGATLDATLDNATLAGVYMFDRANPGTPRLATSALMEQGANGNQGMSANRVGSSVKFFQNLMSRGKIRPDCNLLLVGCAQAGTAFQNYWATTGSRLALGATTDNGSGTFYGQINAALALGTNSRMLSVDWNHGENDGSTTQTQYQNNIIGTFGEVRANIPTAERIPILVTGCPPDRQDPNLGAQVNMGGVCLAQQNVASYLENAVYVDPTGLHSYLNGGSGGGGGFVHFTRNAHLGGVDNSLSIGSEWASGTTYAAQAVNVIKVVLGSDGWYYYSKQAGNLGNDPSLDTPGTWWGKTYQYGQTESNPLSERKYNALINMKWPMTCTWS
jgi:hypothetical protein